MKFITPYTLFFVAVCAIAALHSLTGCAASRVITYDTKLLFEADSLFRNGDYEYAKIRYTKIRDSYPNTEAAARAQYSLGYINVFYENPFANWEAALREFKLFATRYPGHELISQVNSWIRILVVLQSFKQQYSLNTDKLKSALKEQSISKQPSSEASYDILLEAVRKCYSEKDSLLSKIQVLNDVIETIEANQ